MQPNVVVKLPGRDLPALEPGQMRYILAREGVYRERASELFSSCTLMSGKLEELDRHQQICSLHCRKIPTAMIRQMVGFFREAYSLHGGEAALVLLYNSDTDEFQWHCPEQTVKLFTIRGRWIADDSIQFENPLDLPDGFIQFGDAHSHEGPATPSYVDHNDEEHRDGLHLIVGYVGHRRPTYHADFVIDGQRFEFEPEQLLEDFPEPPYPAPPREWLKQIRVHKRSSYSSGYSSWGSGSSRDDDSPGKSSGVLEDSKTAEKDNDDPGISKKASPSDDAQPSIVFPEDGDKSPASCETEEPQARSDSATGTQPQSTPEPVADDVKSASPNTDSQIERPRTTL